ncbi:MAG: hypothetical protein OEM98_03765 [Gammaproteobacteria bacterium]|nr:hypothetical protein [Gammaproteobacteria bacterium]
MNPIFQTSFLSATHNPRIPLRWRGATALFFVVCIWLFSAGQLRADDDPFYEKQFASGEHEGHGGACSGTARAAFRACRNEIRDDYWIAVGNCLNSSEEDCIELARQERAGAFGLCTEQRAARFDLCNLIGEAAYDPEWSPGDFVNPLEIGSGVAPNPYFPLIPGMVWIYKSTFENDEGESVTETITVEVRNETKRIRVGDVGEGVDCIVVNDVVEEDGAVIEDTDDWYAQDRWGNVWYCGEIAKNFESFEGDDPNTPELVNIEGSWKAFRDGAKPGIIMQAVPEVYQVYRQEISLGNAEDAAEVISTSGTESVPVASCDGTCVVTQEFTPIEPGVNANKYYAPDIGLILEVNPGGERVELIDMYMQ